MLKSASAAVLFAVPVVAALSACSPPGQTAATQPGTTPSIWTGSPSPAAPPGEGGHGGGQAASGSETLTAELKTPDGASVATAQFVFSDDYATVTVQTTAEDELSPGFHGLHVHSVGKCEADSVSPTGGAPGDFLSAGGHLQVEGHSSFPASGDLPNLLIRENGAGMLVTTTEAFTAEDLTSGEGTAIMIHAKPGNFGNIPPERYQQVNGTPGPDQESLSTGDAGSRVACGVISGG